MKLGGSGDCSSGAASAASNCSRIFSGEAHGSPSRKRPRSRASCLHRSCGIMEITLSLTVSPPFLHCLLPVVPARVTAHMAATQLPVIRQHMRGLLSRGWISHAPAVSNDLPRSSEVPLLLLSPCASVSHRMSYRVTGARRACTWLRPSRH